MAIKFTDEQQAVIDARQSNILVSAAAGSGKTAVLVERIIQMIEAGLDIDHLLVVTFTNAAASQMKEKITLAIQNKLLTEPMNKHLQKQETLIHNAQITTIDSFCQYVVKNNFNNIGIDPAFRVGDEGELKLVQDEVMQDMLENEYARVKEGGNEDFLYCMNYFGVGSNDNKAAEYIMELYKFAMSMPWPEDYLRDRARDYDCDGDIDSYPWVQDCVSTVKRILKECRDDLVAAEKICCEPDGPYNYGDRIQDEIDQFDNVLKKETYDELFDGVRTIDFQRLPTKKDDSISPEKKKNVQDIRNAAKDKYKSINEKYLALPGQTVLDQMKLCSRAVQELSRLALEFKKSFDEKKRERQLIDFADMEHFALRILVDHPDEESCMGKNCEEIIEMCTPTAVALEYRNYYREVLIDEYQDSNNVQELILKSISGEEPSISERFMVGDVKQSIYKFRLARPEIFMDKLGTFERTEGAKDRRIDLHKNFRSRTEVLDVTNYIFDRIMGRDLGGVDYDEDARLVYGAGDGYGEPSYDVTPEFIIVDADKDDDSDAEAGEVAWTEASEAGEEGEGYEGALLTDDSESYDLSDFDGYSTKEKEALAIAERIHELMQESKELRFKDIVILLRSPSGWDTAFKRVLESQQIPAYVESKSGYFEAYEVSVMLNLLTIIDNPTKDIQLVSVMHSCIGDFSDEELAQLRVMINKYEKAREAESFYNSLQVLVKEGELAGDSDIAVKVRDFMDFLEEIRDMSVYTPVHELLEYIIDRTGFDSYISALPGGSQKRANLELLLSKAVNFEKSSFKGLFHFIRYIEHIKLIEVDYGEAGIIDENADVVRIMSIHKSKGLEFPVVFVAGMAKGFNMRDTKKDLVADMDLGVGVKCIDLENRLKYDTLKRIVIADKMTKDCLGEELRVLYVALTRAKEKLIMTASMKKLGRRLQKALDKLPLTKDDRLLPFSMRLGAGSYFDWGLSAIAAHPAFEGACKKYELDTSSFDTYRDKEGCYPPLKITVLGDADLKEKMIVNDVLGNFRQKELEIGVESGFDAELAKRLKEKFDSKYAFENLKGLYTKTTVTELKKHLLEEMGEVFGKEAEFAQDTASEEEKQTPEMQADSGTERHAAPLKRLSGADRGTAYHRIMELLDEEIFGDEKLTAEAAELFDKVDPMAKGKSGADLDHISKKIYAWMKNLAEKKVIPEEYPGSVWSGDVTRFIGSPLGQRMAKAYREGRLMREKPFMMGIPASELDSRFPDRETVLIQGIIDAWFFEGDDIILMDYKTDKVDREEELSERYSIQLDYYKRALEAATGKKVKEIYIYSFKFGKDIELKIG